MEPASPAHRMEELMSLRLKLISLCASEDNSLLTFQDLRGCCTEPGILLTHTAMMTPPEAALLAKFPSEQLEIFSLTKAVTSVIHKLLPNDQIFHPEASKCSRISTKLVFYR